MVDIDPEPEPEVGTPWAGLLYKLWSLNWTALVCPRTSFWRVVPMKIVLLWARSLMFPFYCGCRLLIVLGLALDGFVGLVSAHTGSGR